MITSPKKEQNQFISPAEALSQPWSRGLVEIPAGKVIRVSTTWNRRDYLDRIRARISSFRMRHEIPPGLYAVGYPDEKSPVLISANYKLSFDMLRRELGEFDAWILVLDTKGINVWCAAGKGTFGTKELVEKIRAVGLDSIVKHRRIIVPQLGAPGLHAHVIHKTTGFYVSFGPIYARDLKAYIQAGYKATAKMRAVHFSFCDRLALTPMELIPALKKSWLFLLAVLILFGLQPSGILFKDAAIGGFPFLLLGAGALLVGAFFTPILLPFIPFRSFALKGYSMGVAFLVAFLPTLMRSLDKNFYLLCAVFLFFPALSSFLALNFTGSTTFTNISGVKKELRIGIPIYITLSVLSVVFIVLYKINTWKIL